MTELTPKTLLDLVAKECVVVRIYGGASVHISKVGGGALFTGTVSDGLRLLRFCWDNKIAVEQYTS